MERTGDAHLTEKASPLRADATRNRAQIVAAAREAFASDGVQVSMAEIARRAGVGFATAQRRFPSKSELIRAVVAEELADKLAELREAVVDPASAVAPWEVLTTALRACAAHQAAQPGLAGAIAEGMREATQSDLGSFFTSAARHAVDSGLARPDLTVDDALAVLTGNAGVIAHSPGREEAASARFVELALRGLLA